MLLFSSVYPFESQCFNNYKLALVLLSTLYFSLLTLRCWLVLISLKVFCRSCNQVLTMISMGNKAEIWGKLISSWKRPNSPRSNTLSPGYGENILSVREKLNDDAQLELFFFWTDISCYGIFSFSYTDMWLDCRA